VTGLDDGNPLQPTINSLKMGLPILDSVRRAVTLEAIRKIALTRSHRKPTTLSSVPLGVQVICPGDSMDESQWLSWRAEFTNFVLMHPFCRVISITAPLAEQHSPLKR
jgi:hypothetical protein